MNRATLNTVVLNAESYSVVQRVAIAMTAVAVAVLSPKALRRGVVSLQQSASVTLVGRALVRGVMEVQARAAIVPTGLERIYASVAIVARAAMTVGGTIYPRRWVSEAVSIVGSAVATIMAKLDARSTVAAEARSVATISTANCYSFVRGVVTAQAMAVPVINFETYKQLPFDEDAIDERTMLVPDDARVMTAV